MFFVSRYQNGGYSQTLRRFFVSNDVDVSPCQKLNMFFVLFLYQSMKSQVMYLKLLKNLLVTTKAVQFLFHVVQIRALCSNDHCLTGAFFFAPGRHMVNNHVLLGHVFDNLTVKEPIECFRKCRCDCRCISFNYLTNVNENNCELNEENRHTNSSALKPLQESQYYDLVVNYDIKVRNALLWPTCTSTRNPPSRFYYKTVASTRDLKKSFAQYNSYFLNTL